MTATGRSIPSVVLAAQEPHPNDGRASAWLAFDKPLAVVCARLPSEVPDCLAELTEASKDGLWSAGYLTYEAASGFDSSLRTHPPDEPVLWFGLFDEPRPFEFPSTPGGGFEVGPWSPSIELPAYSAQIERIHRLIEAGETYQANYTWQLESPFKGDAWSFFIALQKAQDAQHAAWVDTGSRAICSASPELFFERRGSALQCRPMKGTAAASGDRAIDELRSLQLLDSVKNRAENLMIVDMVRNDLGRIAVADSVHCSRLFTIEHYPTVLQMTSTVRATSRRTTTEILQALFPSASITGAPKVRTMELLCELEDRPRGVYTGSIGWIAPGGDASFNVAIRTAVVDRDRGSVAYGTGGGIVWDSRAEDEYLECLTKARILDGLAAPNSLV